MKAIRGATRVFGALDDAGLFPVGAYGPLDFDAFGKNIRQLMESPTIYEPIDFGNSPVELKPDHDFWKLEFGNGRDWKMEKKLRAIGVSQRFFHFDLHFSGSRAELKKLNKRKKQARARTGRR